MQTKIQTIKNSGLIIQTIKEILTEYPKFKNQYGYIAVMIELELYRKHNILITDYSIGKNTISVKTYYYLYCFCLN